MEESIFSAEVFIHSYSSEVEDRSSPVVFLMKFFDFDPQMVEADSFSQSETDTFSSGKSCLFRYKVHDMLTNLKRIPLYLLMAYRRNNSDVQFVGSVSIPMLRIAHALEAEFDLHGLRTPVVKGEKGRFSIYNLMGCSIGSARVSYRIYSLGTLSIQHLPTMMASLDKFVKPSQIKHEVEPAVKTDSQSLVEEKSKRELTPMATQTELNARVPEIKIVEKAEKLPQSDLEVQTTHPKVGELLSTHDPPPLFYRKTTSSKHRGKSGKQAEGNVIHKVESSLDNILNRSSVGIQFVQEKDSSFFPILEGLYRELAKAGVFAGKPEDSPGQEKTMTEPKVLVETSVKETQVSNRDRIIEKPKSSLIHQHSPDKPKHCNHNKRLCEMKVSSSIPARKSWIRTSAIPKSTGKGSSKLEYGLTSTYLARLRTSNPALYGTLSLNESTMEKQGTKVIGESKQDKRRDDSMNRHSKCFNETQIVKAKPPLTGNRQRRKKKANNASVSFDVSGSVKLEKSESQTLEAPKTDEKNVAVVVDLEQHIGKPMDEDKSKESSLDLDLVLKPEEDLEVLNYEVEDDFVVESPPENRSTLNAPIDKTSHQGVNGVHVHPVQKSLEDFEEEIDKNDLGDSKSSCKEGYSYDSKESTQTRSGLDENKGGVREGTPVDPLSELFASSFDRDKIKQLMDVSPDEEGESRSSVDTVKKSSYKPSFTRRR